MTNCPLCNTSTNQKYPNSPYWMCGNCDLWFQDPLPPKVFQAVNELDDRGNAIGHLMSDHDKEVNRYLATQLVGFAGAGKSLDIGSKYPYLAHCLKNLGCEAYGMDGIKEVPAYAQELGVPMLRADFEAISEEQIADWTHTEKFNLVTMIHVFEHMYDPKEAIRKLKRLVDPKGYLFLRVPDHGVQGFEAHMEPHHFSIHPFFWSLPSVLELLKQTKDTFTLEDVSPLSGGQRDFRLRPLRKEPQLWCGMIVKNEERDLPKCLNSIENVVDGLVLVDTGSTDGTLQVAEQFSKPKFIHTYLEASRQDEAGDWKLWDFGKARNRFVDMIDKLEDATHLIWMDADDVLLTPENIRRALYLPQEVFGMMIESGGVRWVHHRMWQTRKGIQFEGRVHEYPNYGGRPGITLSDIVIRHDGAPGFGESSNERNLRILLEEVQQAPTSRNTFYLANTHKDAGRWEEAIPVYNLRITMGEHYRDEWLFAYLYKCRCERSLNRLDDAEKTALEALSHAPTWAEFWMELAFTHYQRSEWEKALGACILAKNCVSQPTQLWRENNMYTDQPLRLMSFCSENMGKLADSLSWAVEAREKIGVFDKDWEERIAALKKRTSTPDTQRPIALLRPGAMGDIIMTLQLVPLLKKKHPGRKIHYFCHGKFLGLLHKLLTQAGIDEIYDSSQVSPDPNYYHKVINLVGYPLAEGYPEVPMQRHLLEYFAKEMGLELSNSLPSLSLSKPKRPSGVPKKYITIHPMAGWSIYKNWSMQRWEKIIAESKLPVYQIGSTQDYHLKGADHTFMGSVDSAVALMANATLHLGVDSYTNHLTHIKWDGKRTPAIILWGSTQSSASGYDHNVNISANLPCQPCFRENPAISAMPRGVCTNPPEQTYNTPRHACMTQITPEMVLAEVNKLLKR